MDDKLAQPRGGQVLAHAVPEHSRRTHHLGAIDENAKGD
jgi:hypothetical protein